MLRGRKGTRAPRAAPPVPSHVRHPIASGRTSALRGTTSQTSKHRLGNNGAQNGTKVSECCLQMARLAASNNKKATEERVTEQRWSARPAKTAPARKLVIVWNHRVRGCLLILNLLLAGFMVQPGEFGASSGGRETCLKPLIIKSRGEEKSQRSWLQKKKKRVCVRGCALT